VQVKLQQHIKELQIEHAREIQRIKESHKLNREAEISVIVEKKLSEEKKSMLVKYSRELEEKDRQIEQARLENTDRIDEMIRQAISNNELKYRQKDAERELHHSRIEADNKKLLDQVEKLQKTLDNIPPELRGTASEFVLLDELKKEFPEDDLRAKTVGVRMADVVQTIVMDTRQKLAIPIVYDRKTGENITKLDITKAKNYKTIHNTDYSIIVTEKGIPNNRLTEDREGVLLVHPRIVIDIARRIRNFLIEISKQKQSHKGRQSKQSKLYEYFTSAEYYRDIQAATEAKEKLDELQRKEEEYHKSIWNRREELVERWFEIHRKNEEIVSDISQEEDQAINQGQSESSENEHDSFS
jgi:hypothetical protein